MIKIINNLRQKFNFTKSKKSDSVNSTSEDTSVTELDTSKVFSWWLLWLMTILVLSGSGVVGLLWLTRTPPTPNCQKLSALATDSDRFYCAQESAKSGKLDQLISAMKIMQSWPVDHPLYAQSQGYIKKLSVDILVMARQQLDQGKLSVAIATIKQIPAYTSEGKQAKNTILKWQETWQKAERIVKDFDQYLQEQKWAEAFNATVKLSEIDINYWRSIKFEELTAKMNQEKFAWQSFQDAKELAKTNNFDNLVQAIKLVSKINPQTYIIRAVKAEKDQWNRNLIALAVNEFKQGNFQQTINIAAQISRDSESSTLAQDWINLSQGEITAKKDDFISRIDAINAIKKISPQSPIYNQSQNLYNRIKTLIQAQMNLETAKIWGNMQQPFTFNLAIKQLGLISNDLPQNKQAKELINQWQKQQQNISDRHNLTTAEKLAQSGLIEDLKNARNTASKISTGQTLYPQAEKLINQWTKQIETIEDQPILDLARAYAQKGDFVSAIKTAQQISLGRALYNESSKLINSWYEKVSIDLDRPLLQQAIEFANQSNYVAAMQIASQISPSSKLYPEAQNLINTWNAKISAPQPLPTPKN
jgi:hypothetical protein